MIRLTDTALAAIRADSEQGIAPGMGDVQLMLAELAQLKAVNFDYQLGADAAKGEIERLKGESDRLRAGVESDLAEVDRIQGEYDKQFRKARTLRIDRDALKAECEGLRAALTDSREFIMHEAKVNCMLVGNGEVSHMFPRRKALVAQVDAALGKGEQA